LIIAFDVNLRTQVLSKVRKSKRFEDIHNLINKLYEEGMGNKEISNYLNSNNIKTQQERIAQDI
jgi:virulence-associated protein VapD